MTAKTHAHLLIAAAISLAGAGFIAHPVVAETITTSDYIYIGVEAEDFDVGTGDERWIVTDSSTPAILEDPDDNHSGTASDGIYLELLPDTRVTYEDPIGPDSFWGAGQGPSASYTLTFPEAGRYYVHGRAYSTGTEDNGLHIGLNGAWPGSGRAMQFCTSALRAWAWRSSQRHSGPTGASCGVNHTLYIDIPTAGDHVITIGAREDGFELDRFALIKDMSGNTRICSAVNVNDVSCKNGSIEVADEHVDLRLLATVDTDQADVGETVNLTLTLENLDAFDTATDIEVVVSTGAGATLDSVNANCDSAGSSSACTLASQTPTAADETFEFALVVSEAGEYVVEAAATSTETDDFPANNTVAQSVMFDTVELVDVSTDVRVVMSATATAMDVGDSAELTVVVANAGEFKSIGTNATVRLPAGLSATSTPSACAAGSDSVLCTLGDIEANESASLVFGVLATAEGSGDAAVSISASNDQDSTNNSAAITIAVAAVIGGGMGGTTGNVAGESAAGATELAILLMLLLAVSARLYWLNQRKPVVLRQ
ncbi:MAG: hypothetical protein V3U65_09930 [Granulosicoccaceae bacterium]